MKDIHLGIGIFDCCGKPHVIYSSSGLPREEAEAEFHQALKVYATYAGEVTQPMLVTMPGGQFLEIESSYHDAPLPAPLMQVAVVDSPEKLAEMLKDMGIDRDIEAGPAQTHAPHATKQ